MPGLTVITQPGETFATCAPMSGPSAMFVEVEIAWTLLALRASLGRMTDVFEIVHVPARHPHPETAPAIRAWERPAGGGSGAAR